MAYPTVSAPYGALPQQLLGQGPFAAAVSRMRIASGSSTAIYYGDFVKQLTTGYIDKDTGTSTLTPIGIFLGVEYTDPTLKYKLFSQYWPASTVASDAMAYVLDDPFVVFKMAACSSTTTMATLTIAAIGSNVAVIQNAGTSTLQHSQNAIDSTSVNTTNTLPIRIIDVVPETGDGTNFYEFYCKFNVGHLHLNTTGI